MIKRLRSPNSTFNNWRPWRAGGKNSSPRPSPKAGEDQCSSLKTVRRREEKFFLTQAFILFRPSTHWIKPTHTREGNLLYSVY